MKRSNKKNILTCIAALIPLLASNATLRATTIADGGFETPTLPVGGQQTFNAGTTLGDWSVVGDPGTQVFLIQTQYAEVPRGITRFGALDGNNSLDISGPGNHGPTVGIQQNISTSAGTTYNLSFYVAKAISSNGDPGYQGAAMVDLVIDNGSRTTYTNDVAGSSGFLAWKLFTVSFVATRSTTSIEFLNNTSETTNEVGLDDISVIAGAAAPSVPEPASLLTLTTACMFLAFRYRKRA